MIKKTSILLLIFILSIKAFACKCYESGTVKESVEKSDVVVHGKVVSRSYVTYRETIELGQGDSLNAILQGTINELFNSKAILKIVLEVKNTYKGLISTDTITIYTPRSSSACGFTGFREGEEYIIYGGNSGNYDLFFSEETTKISTKPGTYWTNQCTRTTEYNEQEARELELLK